MKGASCPPGYSGTGGLTHVTPEAAHEGIRVERGGREAGAASEASLLQVRGGE